MDLVVMVERMPRRGETIHGRQLHTIPGGKGANQAIGCAKLGAQVSMIGAVGSDAFGDKLIERLEACSVSTEAIVRAGDISTGTASITHTPEDNSIVIVSGANLRCSSELVDTYRDRIGSADTLLVQLEIPLASVRRALEWARRSGVRTILNPAPAVPLSRDLTQLVDFISPNETEFEILSGTTWDDEESLAQAMRQWEYEFGARVLITRGDKGCSYLEGDELYTISAPNVQVIDTTGAGDAFNAAFSVAVSQGMSIREAISFAVQAASFSVTRFGAQDGMPVWEEVLSITSTGT